MANEGADLKFFRISLACLSTSFCESREALTQQNKTSRVSTPTGRGQSGNERILKSWFL
jgi:hypothetical protein